MKVIYPLRSVLLLFVFSFLMPSCQAQEPSKKRHTSTTETFRDQQFVTFTCPSSDIRFFSKNQGVPFLNFETLNQHLSSKDQQLIFATNGGMYTPSSEPVGLYIEDGIQKKELVTRNGKGNFHLNPNGVFYITKDGKAGVLETNAYASAKIEAKYATQSGPLLLIDGKIHPKFNDGSSNKYVRSGAGILPNGDVVFIISKKPVNFYTFALLFKEKFGCKDALYFDGGVSKMYLPAQERFDKRGVFSSIIAVIEPK